MMKIEPRVIRAGQAPAYLGMSLPHFNEHVRPFLVEVQDAAKMISFDRLDLDAWWEHHKQANGKPAKEKQKWQKEHLAFENKAKYGTLTKLSVVSTYEKAREKRNLSKQNAS
jgi:hypothetical protein